MLLMIILDYQLCWNIFGMQTDNFLQDIYQT